MTVDELIAQLQSLPPETKVLACVQGDYAMAEEPKLMWGRDRGEDWWQIYWSSGPPKFSMGFEQVVIIS